MDDAYDWDDWSAQDAILADGWDLTDGWNWYRNGDQAFLASERARSAAIYLFDEWDWGYFVNALEPGEKIVRVR